MRSLSDDTDLWSVKGYAHLITDHPHVPYKSLHQVAIKRNHSPVVEPHRSKGYSLFKVKRSTISWIAKRYISSTIDIFEWKLNPINLQIRKVIIIS